ncbi:MAG: lysylphosphatidylglycerol synthase domain-containing protein [Halobacteriaceae archaeon]
MTDGQEGGRTESADGSDGDVEVSVVLPAYNEADTIEETVRITLDELSAFLPSGRFEVIVAEDGCDDETPAIADRLAAADDRVRHVHSDERLGRGGALERAFRAARGSTLVYFDTDLATDMDYLQKLVESVRTEGYDVATGSRWIPGHEADRPTKRGIPSRGFNLLVRTLLGSEMRDHQCGFKAFDREALESLLGDVEDDHWFWDTEVLVRAQRRGYDVREFPVEWEPKGDTKVDLVRDVFGMGSQIVRVWWEFAVSPRVNRTTGLAAGTVLSLLAVGLLFVYLDPSAVIAEMRGAEPGLVVAAAAVYLLSWPIRGRRYRDILAEMGFTESTGFLTGAVFISQTGNLVFPARAGDAVRAYVVKTRRRVPYPSGFASLAVERVFDLLTITALAGAVLLGLATLAPDQLTQITATLYGSQGGLGADQRASARTAIAVAVVVGTGAIAAVAAIVLSARTDRTYVRPLLDGVSDDAYVEYVAGIVGQFVRDVQTVAGDRATFARVGATSLAVWSLDVATALVVLIAFDTGLPVAWLAAVCFFAVSVGNLAKVLPLSPGGIGLYEGAFTLLVIALTPISPAVALGAALVDHGVKNAVTIVGGAASMLLLNVSLVEAVEADTEPRVDGETVGEGKA